MPIRPERDETLVTHVIQARGVAFRAVAVLGLTEGEFPTTINEDPFLRDADRERLRQDFKFALDSSTESAEIEYFYETITRPWERMLLTRPRLADNGATWQASPYWEEVRRLLSLKPQSLRSGEISQFAQAASWPELVESLSLYTPSNPVWQWTQQQDANRLAALQTSTLLFRSRDTSNPSPFDGDLSGLAADFAHRFAPDHSWSASRLEKYRTCAYLFFVANVLGLEPREEPIEGLDRRQLGNIYHRILKQVYEVPGPSQPVDLEQLVAALDHVAPLVLDEAPKKEGFRETAWWQQTRLEIVENIRRSLRALSEISKEFSPILPNGLEAGFWGSHALVVKEDGDSFRVHGIIDRIDRDGNGNVRIIDYKTSGPTSFDSKAIIEGKKLQVPLYALAAQDALKLGKIREGFYWHVIQAEASRFQLSEFNDGPEGAIAIAIEKSWEAVRGARRGHFVPSSPDDGCPDYCPAATFCWHFHPGFRG
jgi:ATP-dependent helicase/DNAse subunit B